MGSVIPALLGDDDSFELLTAQVIIIKDYDNSPSRALSEGMAEADDETDSTLVWVCFSVISSVIALSSFLVWVAILLTPKTRSSPFNVSPKRDCETNYMPPFVGYPLSLTNSILLLFTTKTW